MSVVARIVRSFGDGLDLVALERAVALSTTRPVHHPDRGVRLDLRAHGVEALLEVVGVTIRSQRDVPGLRQPDVDLFLRHEPLAREGGWRDVRDA